MVATRKRAAATPMKSPKAKKVKTPSAKKTPAAKKSTKKSVAKKRAAAASPASPSSPAKKAKKTPAKAKSTKKTPAKAKPTKKTPAKAKSTKKSAKKSTAKKALKTKTPVKSAKKSATKSAKKSMKKSVKKSAAKKTPAKKSAKKSAKKATVSPFPKMVATPRTASKPKALPAVIAANTGSVAIPRNYYIQEQMGVTPVRARLDNRKPEKSAASNAKAKKTASSKKNAYVVGGADVVAGDFSDGDDDDEISSEDGSFSSLSAACQPGLVAFLAVALVVHAVAVIGSTPAIAAVVIDAIQKSVFPQFQSPLPELTIKQIVIMATVAYFVAGHLYAKKNAAAAAGVGTAVFAAISFAFAYTPYQLIGVAANATTTLALGLGFATSKLDMLCTAKWGKSCPVAPPTSISAAAAALEKLLPVYMLCNVLGVCNPLGETLGAYITLTFTHSASEVSATLAAFLALQLIALLAAATPLLSKVQGLGGAAAGLFWAKQATALIVVPKLAYNLYNNADGAVTAPFVYVVAGTVLHFLGNGN